MEVAELAQEIEAVRQRATEADMSEPLKAVRAIALQDHRDHFNSSVTPDGEAWLPRKREGDGHPLLMESGRLMQAAVGQGGGHVTRIESREMELGVQGIDYAAAQNFGYEPRNLPAREWLGMSEKAIDAGAEAVADLALPIILGEGL